MTNIESILSASIPSVLVILSWVHNNMRLSRLEALRDATSRRMDELQNSMHSDMLSFQSAVLGEIASIRERMAVVESRG